MNRLLIVACSQRKRKAKGFLPAIERYDGPVFRVLRKHLREESGDALSILVLSAKYDLIPAEFEIPDYDCRLSVASAVKLRPQVLETARRALQKGLFDAVGICTGKDYRVALAGFCDLIPDGVQVGFIAGGQGPRLAALRE